MPAAVENYPLANIVTTGVMINPVMGGTVSEGSEFDTEQVVLIAAVGGALLLIAVIFIVVLATVCAYKRRGNCYQCRIVECVHLY